MNIEHIKSLSLKDYLANKGHYPVKEYTTYGMYRSPFREESTPSFKVDYRANLWYDFGCGEGGSIIDLVMKLHGCTLSQAIGLLDNCVEIRDRKSTRLNSSHLLISYAVFCLKKKT